VATGRSHTPTAFIVFLVVKIAAKLIGVYPVTKAFGSPQTEAMYTTLLMSTGLTFGTISSLYGLSHGIITQGQYSALVAAVIGSAVIPTLIANAIYLPRHLLPKREVEAAAADLAALPGEADGGATRKRRRARPDLEPASMGPVALPIAR